MSSPPRINLVQVRTPKPSMGWMLMLADLMSLLLTFFVMIYATTAPSTMGWESITGHFQITQPMTPIPPILPVPGEDAPILPSRDGNAMELHYVHRLLERQMERMKSLDGITLATRNDRLTISLASDVFFSPGSAELANPHQPALAELAAWLGRLPNRLAVEGHTDPRPLPANSPIPGNWGLSLARANAVAESIAKAGYTSPIERLGRADGAFTETPNAGTLAAQYQKARRVDIIIYP